ncbi:DNA polymerase I [Escherichia phage M01]|nr:DNA polymerase I [Escherichia phage M01]
MFGMDPDDIKKNFKEIRQIGKACELGLGYEGASERSLRLLKT